MKAAKNLMALYGLFENQIEEWIPGSQRDEELWCGRLRLGMEKLKREKVPGTKVQYYATEPRRRYTTEEFTEGIYACKSLGELKTFVSGEPMAGKWADGSERKMRDSANYSTVNISLERANKPTTIDFRHQKGTIDSKIIYHWVKFCGALVQTAWHFAQQDFEFRNAGPITANNLESSYLRLLLERRRGRGTTFQKIDIMELVGLSEDSKTFLREQKKQTLDELHQAQRHIDEFIIKVRSERLAKGKRPGVEMDAQIEVSIPRRRDAPTCEKLRFEED